jgi:hypothetical protein
VGDLDAHRDALLLLRVELVAQQAVEEVEIGRLLARGVGKQCVEALGDRTEPQPLQVVPDPRTNKVGHATPPMWSA